MDEKKSSVVESKDFPALSDAASVPDASPSSSSAPVQWQRLVSGVYVDYDPETNVEIERNYLLSLPSAKITIGRVTHAIDFAEMVDKAPAPRGAEPVIAPMRRRLSDPARWSRSEIFLPIASGAALQALRTLLQPLPPVRLEITEHYDAERGRLITLHGQKDTVIQAELRVSVWLSFSDFQLPPHWLWKPFTGAAQRLSDYLLIEEFAVKPSSEEWNWVVAHLDNLERVQITGIQRIQNSVLAKEFLDAAKLMAKPSQGLLGPKQLMLFHGTRGNDPRLMYATATGFDFRLANESGMFGAGVYFATRSSYSDNYAFPSPKGQQMFLCSVLVGDACDIKEARKPPKKMKKSRGAAWPAAVVPMPVFPMMGGSGSASLRKPPMKSTGEEYDSVCGVVDGSLNFCIYNHHRAYPRYLITYNRTGPGR